MHSSKRHIFYLQKLYKKIKEYKNNDELPIGCIIVCPKTGEIIAFGLNTKDYFPFDHAEAIAIEQMIKGKHREYDNYHLYTSLEPCLSCAQIIKETNIKTVFYGCRSLDNGIHSKYKLNLWPQVSILPTLFLEKEFSLLLKKFFEKKRSKISNI
jgi:tRNA(adenine34) deaminase